MDTTKLKHLIVNSSKIQENYPEIIIGLLNKTFQIRSLWDSYYSVSKQSYEICFSFKGGTIDTLRVVYNNHLQGFMFYGFYSSGRSTKERIELDSFKI